MPQASNPGRHFITIIPGLPNELVSAHILARLPWYVRPIASLVSTTWKLVLEDPVLVKQTQTYQVPALDGAVVLWKVDQSMVTLDAGGKWRALPPLPYRSSVSSLRKMVASRGIIIVWKDEDGCYLPYKLDLGKGQWKWQSLYDMKSDHFPDALAFQGKLYVGWSWQDRVQVYCMDTSVWVEGACFECVQMCKDIVVTDRIYAIRLKEPSGHPIVLDVMVFDPTENTWNVLRTVEFQKNPPFTITPVYDGCLALSWIQCHSLSNILWYIPESKEWVLVRNNLPSNITELCYSNGFLYGYASGGKLWKSRAQVIDNSIEWEEIYSSDQIAGSLRDSIAFT